MLDKVWSLSVYTVFERTIAILLSIGVIGVIVISCGHLAMTLYTMAQAGFVEFSYAQFQSVFEQILTVLIALEFNHSLTQVAAGVRGFIQVRTILLIAILALVRKFIVLEIETTSGVFLLGLAASMLALGAVYSMLVYIEKRDENHHESISSPGQPPS